MAIGYINSKGFFLLGNNVKFRGKCLFISESFLNNYVARYSDGRGSFIISGPGDLVSYLVSNDDKLPIVLKGFNNVFLADIKIHYYMAKKSLEQDDKKKILKQVGDRYFNMLKELYCDNPEEARAIIKENMQKVGLLEKDFKDKLVRSK